MFSYYVSIYMCVCVCVCLMLCFEITYDIFDFIYTTIRHRICLKTVLYFCKRTVLKILCHQNIYREKHDRNGARAQTHSRLKTILMSNVSLR